MIQQHNKAFPIKVLLQKVVNIKNQHRYQTILQFNITLLKD
jgi:hypothetical protein